MAEESTLPPDLCVVCLAEGAGDPLVVCGGSPYPTGAAGCGGRANVCDACARLPGSALLLARAEWLRRHVCTASIQRRVLHRLQLAVEQLHEARLDASQGGLPNEAERMVWAIRKLDDEVEHFKGLAGCA